MCGSWPFTGFDALLRVLLPVAVLFLSCYLVVQPVIYLVCKRVLVLWHVLSVLLALFPFRGHVASSGRAVDFITI
jgi:hypothetical protein